MRRNLYVIYDRVANESGPVFEAPTDGVAHRRYKSLMAEQTHEWFDETDYTLIIVGSICKVTNIVEAIKPKEVYINLSLLEDEENAESV